jgi:hypothetical protein
VSREAAPRLGSLTTQNQNSPRLGFHVGGVTPLIPVTFLVSAELCQSIPIMRFMVSADLIQPIPKIFCIGWVTSADTNKAQPINTAHTPLFQPSTTVAVATILTESNCSDRDYLFEVFFNFL